MEKVTGVVLKMLLSAGAFTWVVCGTSKKLKRYAFLTFSTFCIMGALYFGYVWRGAEKQIKEGEQETSRRMVTNLTEVAEQAAGGSMPRMKPVGNAVFDAALPAMNALSQDLFGYLNRMEDEIDALNREDVFSESALAKESAIASEIRKRLESQNIIERYKKGLPPMIESARTKFTSLRASDDVKRGAVRGFDKAASAQVPKLDEMFLLRLRREKAEADFLRFMLAAFSDYRFAEKVISFKTPANSQRYKGLAQGIQDAIKDAEAFQQRQLRAVEALKTQVEKLAP